MTRFVFRDTSPSPGAIGSNRHANTCAVRSATSRCAPGCPRSHGPSFASLKWSGSNRRNPGNAPEPAHPPSCGAFTSTLRVPWSSLKSSPVARKNGLSRSATHSSSATSYRGVIFAMDRRCGRTASRKRK